MVTTGVVGHNRTCFQTDPADQRVRRGFNQLAQAIIASPACILAAWLALGSKLFHASRRDQTMMVLFGVVLISYQWLYLAAVDSVGVTTATLISLLRFTSHRRLSVSPLFLHEPITRRLLVALAGAITGVTLLIGRPEAGAADETIIGVGLAPACAALLALHALGMRSLAGRVHPLQPLAIGFPVGAIAITPIVLMRGVSLDQPAQAWFWLVFLGLVPSSIAYLLFQHGLATVTASVATVVTMLEPFIAALLAWMFFEEQLGIAGWIGGGILMASIWFLSGGRKSRRLQRRPPQESPPTGKAG
ncbi:MAG: EamA family transporter [Thermomicrobiales bacterium]